MSVFFNELDNLTIFLESIQSPVVFCHNDAQEGNIMYDEKKGTIQLIDYEYGAYNYRGFDFGNHFCEWAIDNIYTEAPGFQCLRSRYPTVEQRYIFCSEYLRETNPNVSEEEINKLSYESWVFTLASHFMWCIWSICQSKKSEIHFGFLEYAAMRWNEYNYVKQDVNMDEIVELLKSKMNH